MGPSWSLLHIPIHFESIDRHWKHSCGFDFSTPLSFLSNNEIPVHREKCTYTYTVKYFTSIGVSIVLGGCRQVICECHWWSLQEDVHIANTLVQTELIKCLASNTKRIIQFYPLAKNTDSEWETERKENKVERNIPLWVNREAKLFLLVSSISMETWGGDGTSFIETWQVLIRKLWGFLRLKDRAPIMTSGISDRWGRQYRENCPIDLNSSRYVIGWESEIRNTFLRCRDRKCTSLSVETKFSLLYNLQTCLFALISTV